MQKTNPTIRHGGVPVRVLALAKDHPDAGAWRAFVAQQAAEDVNCEVKRADTYALYAGGIEPPEGGSIIFEGYGPGRFPGECSVIVQIPGQPACRAFCHCDQLERVKE